MDDLISCRSIFRFSSIHFSKGVAAFSCRILAELLLYSVSNVTITSANNWYLLILFNFIGTIDELGYSPVRNVEMANMIPEDRRGSYSAFSNFPFSGADLLARSTIIIGAFLIPTMMSVYISALLLIGTLLV